MRLTDDDISKFQSLYKSELGIDISKEDAMEKGIKFLRLMSIIYKPMTEEEHELVQKRRLDDLIKLLN